MIGHKDYKFKQKSCLPSIFPILQLELQTLAIAIVQTVLPRNLCRESTDICVSIHLICPFVQTKNHT